MWEAMTEPDDGTVNLAVFGSDGASVYVLMHNAFDGIYMSRLWEHRVTSMSTTTDDALEEEETYEMLPEETKKKLKTKRRKRKPKRKEWLRLEGTR